MSHVSNVHWSALGKYFRAESAIAATEIKDMLTKIRLIIGNHNWNLYKLTIGLSFHKEDVYNKFDEEGDR